MDIASASIALPNKYRPELLLLVITKALIGSHSPPCSYNRRKSQLIGNHITCVIYQYILKTPITWPTNLYNIHKIESYTLSEGNKSQKKGNATCLMS